MYADVSSYLMSLGALVVLLPLCWFATGFLVVRHLRLSPLERLCTSIAVSQFFIYAYSFVVYLLYASPNAYYAIPCVSAIALAFSWKDARRLWNTREVRDAAKGLALVCGWAMLAQACILHYSGAGWTGDWEEHYERCVFFLAHPAVTQKIIGIYELPARPPLMNLVAASFMAQAGVKFFVFQVLFSWMNLISFLPCILWGRAWSAGRRFPATSLAALLVLLPLFTVNITYTWTKLGAAFYVILAAYLYWRGMNRKEPARIVLAFASLAAGCLAHYSAGPFAVVMGGHYVWLVMRRVRRPGEFFSTVLLSGALLATWFAWSFGIFGAESTLASNTAVAESRHMTVGGNLAKIGTNLVFSAIPNVPAILDYVHGETGQGLFPLRDSVFLLQQQSLLFGCGFAGGVLCLLALASRVRRKDRRGFWLTFALAGGLLGIAVHGTREPIGVAHIGLQPLILIAVTLVLTWLPAAPRWVRILAVVGWTIDFALGVWLQLRVQAMFPVTYRTENGLEIGANGFTSAAVDNAGDRLMRGYEFLGDMLELASPALLALAALFGIAAILHLARRMNVSH